MTGPITFNPIPGTPRIEAMLGTQLVGIVSRYPYTGSSFGKVEATYQLRLPVKGAIPMAAPTASLKAAIRLLLIKLAEWHEAADAERYAEMIIALRAQAEGEGA